MILGVPVNMRDLPVLGDIFYGAVRFASSAEGFCAQVAAAIDEPSEGLAARGRPPSVAFRT